MREPTDHFPPARAGIDPIVVAAALLLLLFVGSMAGNALFGAQPPADAAGPIADIYLTPTARATRQPAANPTPFATATARAALPTARPASPTPSAAAPTHAAPTANPTRPPATPLPAINQPPAGDFVAPTPTAPPPLPTPIAATSARVPILMYHYTGEPPADADIYRRDLSVSPEALRAQLTWLRDNGYTPIDLYTLARALAGQVALPPQPVVLTFDDGYRDNYEVAFPLLKEFGMVGTFFIVSDFVSSGNPNYMTWAMVQEMAWAGMAMENHSRTHPDLRELTREEVVYQLRGAQEALALHTGRQPRFLAYPGGFYDDETLAVVRELDLWGAVTTQYGYTHSYADRYEMKRVRMRYSTTLAQFAALVRGAP